MNATLKPYPTMKPSGVEWMGDVPIYWKILPGRVCFREKKQVNVALQEKTVLSLSYGQIVVKPAEKLHGLVPASFETYQIVDPLNIVIRPTDLQNDQTSLRFGLSRHRGIITSAYLCLLTKKFITPEYGYLLLHSYDLMKIFYGLGSGLRQNLDWKDFRYLPCLVPSLPEQTAIVRFLDHADRRIRRYIRTKQKLIALLEDQKQAIIHQTVTGRIDVRSGRPYPAYKPSGVEWLEDVPEHWGVLPLKRICKFSSGAGFPISAQGNTDHEFLFVKVSDMNRLGNERELINSANTVSREVAQELGAQVFEQNTIIFPKVGGALLTNKRRILVHEACIDNNLMGCIVTGADVEFTFRILEWLNLARIAKPGPVPAISEGEVREIRITLPPLSEQTAIVRFLDQTTAEINNVVDRTRRQIELFQEYRTRLIADVVTGKLDVRKAAAALPEVDPLEAEDELENTFGGDAEEMVDELDAIFEEAEA